MADDLKEVFRDERWEKDHKYSHKRVTIEIDFTQSPPLCEVEILEAIQYIQKKHDLIMTRARYKSEEIV
jgi:hypothetical protein